MSNRQSTIKKLVETYYATSIYGSSEQFEKAQDALADYVAKNIEHITIASDPKREPKS